MTAIVLFPLETSIPTTLCGSLDIGTSQKEYQNEDAGMMR